MKLLSKSQQELPSPWLLEKVTVGDSAHRTMTFQGSKKRLKYSYKSILGTFKYFQCKGKMSFLSPLRVVEGGLLGMEVDGFVGRGRLHSRTFHTEMKVQLTSNLICVWKLNLQWPLEKLSQGRGGHCKLQSCSLSESG